MFGQRKGVEAFRNSSLDNLFEGVFCMAAKLARVAVVGVWHIFVGFRDKEKTKAFRALVKWVVKCLRRRLRMDSKICKWIWKMTTACNPYPDICSKSNRMEKIYLRDK
jgi:hypothetical protein